MSAHNQRFTKPEIRDAMLLTDIFRGLSRGTLTLVDILSTEAITREHLSEKVWAFLKNKKWNHLPEKQAVTKINKIYKWALSYSDFVAMELRKSQKDRVFKTVNEFIDWIDSIKPENIHSPYEMVMECMVARAMLLVADVENNERIKELDKESKQILSKIRNYPGITILRENGESFELTYNPPSLKDGWFFRGRVYFRPKELRKILLKENYNRKYGTSELMKDLVGLRCECPKEGRECMENAILFFAKHIFHDPELGTKGDIVSAEFRNNSGIRTEPEWSGNSGSNKKLKNADLTGTIKIGTNGDAYETGVIEMQFQPEGEMATGMRHPKIYEACKFMSANARNLPGITIANIKFFVQLIALESGVPEKAILSNLFCPQPKEDFKFNPDETEFPYPEHGFLLPLNAGTNGIRFSTREVWTQELATLYKDYPQPTQITFEEFVAMYDTVDLNGFVKKFKEKWKL